MAIGPYVDPDKLNILPKNTWKSRQYAAITYLLQLLITFQSFFSDFGPWY